MPQFDLVIIYTLAFLLTLAAIRKSLMVTGWEWNNEPAKHRHISSAIFLGYVAVIVTVVAACLTLSYPEAGGLMGVAIAVIYLMSANYAYWHYSGKTY